MPEGLEVYHLAHVLRTTKGFTGEQVTSWGKHLYIYDQDWSFGLSGRVAWAPDSSKVIKVNVGRVYGSVVSGNASYGRGVDFATATAEALHKAVAEMYMGSRRKLGALVLDQDLICGLGVAWGSEVLHRAGGLQPQEPAKDQDLRRLAAAMVSIRQEALDTYARAVPTMDGWFDALYAVRRMEVYKRGTAVVSGGRTWWV